MPVGKELLSAHIVILGCFIVAAAIIPPGEGLCAFLWVYTIAMQYFNGMLHRLSY